MKINCETPNGGAVEFNKEHGAWASYSVAGVADLPTPELMYASVKLPDGRTIQCFINRETGLVVVDVINKGGKSGTEILRKNV